MRFELIFILCGVIGIGGFMGYEYVTDLTQQYADEKAAKEIAIEQVYRADQEIAGHKDAVLASSQALTAVLSEIDNANMQRDKIKRKLNEIDIRSNLSSWAESDKIGLDKFLNDGAKRMFMDLEAASQGENRVSSLPNNLPTTTAGTDNTGQTSNPVVN